MKIKQSKAKQSKAKQSKAKQEPECKKHKWIPLAGKGKKGKKVPTALFTCLKCGDLKVGTHTIKISRYRMDMGELPMNSIAGIKLMNQPSADLTASGLIMTATVDTNAQGIGAPLYMAANGHLITADADTSATSPCVALAMETGTGSKKVLVHGVLRVDAWNWTTGPGDASLIYVSTNVGTLTQNQPGTTNTIIQPVGWALTADSVYFSPTMMYITHDVTWYGERGVIFAGAIAIWTEVNSIDYITISSLGNAADFGDLSATNRSFGALSNGNRGVCACVGMNTNVIEYITISTTGNSTDFGDATYTQYTYRTGLSSTVRGCFAGGFYSGGGEYNVIEYITIASTGNAVDFGDITTVMREGGCCSNNTRGILGGGITDDTPTYRNIIDYITIASVGNATDFGDLTSARVGAACSNNILGVISGGSGTGNIIDYVTIATTGNATDFGDTIVARGVPAACSHNIKGVWAGSGTGLGSSLSNVIDYILFSTLSNSTDFGDLTVPRHMTAGCSGN
ncbi:MAG: hypothetical protein NT161_02915 [Candidatus Nomurabacteria bacterium]|nr:hypothetical protein [Candidatus Nomurabacteria bacterium]